MTEGDAGENCAAMSKRKARERDAACAALRRMGALQAARGETRGEECEKSACK